ncbi:MAG: hypothetical protein UDG94_00585, partial [Peptococcaceae bacterium]|nr:hypothetical protein [Peptococcaceae bacterium]
SSSLIHCSVAFSSTGFCSLGCLIFKEQPAASATAHLYYHNSFLSVKNFFQVFSESFELGVGTRAPTKMYYTRTSPFRQPLFLFFCLFLFYAVSNLFFCLLSDY